MPVITLDGPKITREQKAKLVKEFVTKAAKYLISLNRVLLP